MTPGSFPSPEAGGRAPNLPTEEEPIDEQPNSSKKHSSDEQHHHHCHPSSRNMEKLGNDSEENYPNFIDHLVAAYPADDCSEEACRAWLRLIFTPLSPDVDCEDLHLSMGDIEKFYADKNMKSVFLYFRERGIQYSIAKRASLDIFCAIAQRHIIAGRAVRGPKTVHKFGLVDVGVEKTLASKAAFLCLLLSVGYFLWSMFLFLLFSVVYALWSMFRGLAI